MKPAQICKPIKALWLVLCVLVAHFAHADKISTYPTISISKSNDWLIIDQWNGSAFTTKAIPFSNVVFGVASSISNINHGDYFTNKSGDLVLLGSPDGSSTRHMLEWRDSSDTLLGSIWYNIAHPHELQVNSPKSISLNLGTDAQNDGILQLGSSLGTHEVILHQYDLATSGGAPLGYSKYDAWGITYWTGSAQAYHYMGLRGEALDSAGNTELVFYKNIHGVSQALDASNLRMGSMHSNGRIYWGDSYFTNTIQAGTAAGTGVGGVSPVIDIASGQFPAVIIGGDLSAKTRTVSTPKYFYWAAAAYDNSTPIAIFGGSDTSGASETWYGGNTGTLRAMNTHRFFAAASHNGTTGTEILTMDSNSIRPQENVAVTGSISATGNNSISSANGASWTWGQNSELLTLSTVGATTDTAANLLPVNSIIESVVARVTTTITTATAWQIGDATIAARFVASQSTMTAGTTAVGLQCVDQTGTSGPKQAAAAKVRVTTTGTPGAGVIRITVFYRQFVAPTS